MTTEICLFCQHYSLHKNGTFELPDVSYFFYYWDIHPVTPGHLLIIPKKHTAGYAELSEEELKNLPFAVLKAYEVIEKTNLTQVYTGLLEAFTDDKSHKYLNHALQQLQKMITKPDGYNHGLNDGRAAGRTIDHFHYHIMPRWAGDSEDPRGGIRHMFDGMGNYEDGMNL